MRDPDTSRLRSFGSAAAAGCSRPLEFGWLADMREVQNHSSDERPE